MIKSLHFNSTELLDQFTFYRSQLVLEVQQPVVELLPQIPVKEREPAKDVLKDA